MSGMMNSGSTPFQIYLAQPSHLLSTVCGERHRSENLASLKHGVVLAYGITVTAHRLR
jgi:hypothetical protein